MTSERRDEQSTVPRTADDAQAATSVPLVSQITVEGIHRGGAVLASAAAPKAEVDEIQRILAEDAGVMLQSICHSLDALHLRLNGVQQLAKLFDRIDDPDTE